jgi:acetyl esterase/lipase
MTEYRIDPELLPWLSMVPDIDLTADVVTGRARLAELTELFPKYDLPDSLSRREVTVPGRDGAPGVRARIYTPTAASTGPRAGYLHIHGGGFVMGDIETFEQSAAEVAIDCDAVVITPDYRLAPEDPFPAGAEDCYATLEWLAANAGELGVDPDRIAVGGESAGGGLAATVALLARDRQGPKLCFQLLDIPELDDRMDTPSMVEFVDTPLWNRPAAELSWKHYLSGDPGETALRYAAPARMEDLSGLPPAFIATCEFDPLRDEGLIYAQRLLAAGVTTEVHSYIGTFHGSGIVQNAAVSRRMAADKQAALRRALAPR